MGVSWTREKISLAISQQGFKLLNIDYRGVDSKVTVSCSRKHKISVIFKTWKSGGFQCSVCNYRNRFITSLNKKLNSISMGWKWIDFDSKKVCIVCNKDPNHTEIINRNLLQVRKGCNYCREVIRYTYTDVKLALQKEDYILLSEKYINCKTDLDVQCPNGHKFKTTWDLWLHGKYRCPLCSNKKHPLSPELVKYKLQQHGFELLTEYENIKSIIKVKCSQGHIYETTYQNIRATKFNCKHCTLERQFLNESVIKDYIKDYNYVLVNPYIRSNQKMHLVCPCGHDYFVTWDNFKWNHRRCPRCGSGTSRLEKEFIVDIEQFGINMVLHDRQLIQPLELDIVLPSHKLALELSGLYWHGEIYGNKDYKYHLNKLEKCLEQNYMLINIFEDEYRNNKDIVFSRLQGILGLYKNKVFARMCTIREITNKESFKFLEENHLQGSGRSSYKIGAFYKNELVAVMTFSTSNLSRSFKRKRGVWELERFCVKKNMLVVGIASKLLKYFESHKFWLEIISYADRRWSSGNLYYKLGFEFVHNTKPNYWYFYPHADIKSMKRIHRFTLRKNKNDNPELSEWENRKLQGYDRIWDCGSIKFRKRNVNV